MATIASLNVLLSLNSNGFRDGVANAVADLKEFKQHVKTLSKELKAPASDVRKGIAAEARQREKQIADDVAYRAWTVKMQRQVAKELQAEKRAAYRLDQRLEQENARTINAIHKESAALKRQQDQEERRRAQQPGSGLGRMVGTAAMAPFRRGLDLASGALRQFSLNLSGAYYHLGPFSMRVGPGAAALIGLATGLKAAAMSAVETAADFEKTEIAFEVMTGSAERAQAVLKQIYDFAAVTPFEIKDVTKAVQQFTAVGIEAETAFQMVKRLGNIAAAMPDSMAENLNRVVRALSQMHAKGTVQAEEMTRQLSNAGIPAWEALAHRIGVTVPEAMDRARAGMISAREAILAILDLANSPRFATMQARQAQTMIGLWSTLKDNVTLFMRDLGQLIIKGFDLKGAATTLTGFFQFLRNKLAELEPAIMKIGTVFRAAFDVGLGVLRLLIQGLADWTKALDASPASLQKLRDAVIRVFGAIATFTVNALEMIGNVVIELVNLIRGKLGPALGGLFEGGAGKALDRIALGWRQIFKNIGLGGGIDQKELNRQALALDPKVGVPAPLAKLNFGGARAGIRDMLDNLRNPMDDFQKKAVDVAGHISNVFAQHFRAAAIDVALSGKLGQAGLVKFILALRGMAEGVPAVAQNIFTLANGVKVFWDAVEAGAGSISLLKFGEFSKAINDAVKDARTPLQELHDEFKRTNMMLSELAPQAAMFIGQGFINPLLLARREAGNVVAAIGGVQDAQAKALIKRRNELMNKFQGKDTPAMQAGSQEAVSTMNRALNEQNRGQMNMEQLMRAIAAETKREADEVAKVRLELAAIKAAVGVK